MQDGMKMGDLLGRTEQLKSSTIMRIGKEGNPTTLEVCEIAQTIA